MPIHAIKNLSHTNSTPKVTPESKGKLGDKEVSCWTSITTWMHENRKAIVTAILIIGIVTAAVGLGLAIYNLNSGLVAGFGDYGVGFRGASGSFDVFLTTAGKTVIAGLALFVTGTTITWGSGGYLLGMKSE